MSPQRARFADGRWHFQHGPIDLVIFLEGPAAVCEAAIGAAWRRFETVLSELSRELPELRGDVGLAPRLRSPIARRMASVCWPYHTNFGLYVTPMAAVAGSVAQEILACLRLPEVRRASVNNGGDIALFVRRGASFRIGVVGRPDIVLGNGLPKLTGSIAIDAAAGLEGIATSGWRGRSLSLGIADAVTVLAKTAAQADAAATLIANAVNVEDDAIERLPANQVRDDSDLHDRLVTRAVAPLPPQKVQLALARGAAFADRVRELGLIDSAFLLLQGQQRLVRTQSVRTPSLQCA